jgi:hypothetical protein
MKYLPFVLFGVLGCCYVVMLSGILLSGVVEGRKRPREQGRPDRKDALQSASGSRI